MCAPPSEAGGPFQASIQTDGSLPHLSGENKSAVWDVQFVPQKPKNDGVFYLSLYMEVQQKCLYYVLKLDEEILSYLRVRFWKTFYFAVYFFPKDLNRLSEDLTHNVL